VNCVRVMRLSKASTNDCYSCTMVPVIMVNLLIQSDGGCSPNPGNKYCSYAMWIGKNMVSWRSKVPLGHGTNNEAEWEGLILALRDAVEKVNPAETTVTVATDSRVVLSRLGGRNKPGKTDAQKNMWAKAAEARELLQQFHGYQTRWIPRDQNVYEFGH
jgi:ribonuclease HI